MKIYEKPMALIEKIEVEDVITASAPAAQGLLKGSQDASAIAGASDTNVIVFEW